MTKRVVVNVPVVVDGVAKFVDTVDTLTRKQLLELMSDPANLPDNLKNAARNWTTIDWKQDDAGTSVTFVSREPVYDVDAEALAQLFPEISDPSSITVVQKRVYVNRRKELENLFEDLEDYAALMTDDSRTVQNDTIRDEILAAVAKVKPLVGLE